MKTEMIKTVSQYDPCYAAGKFGSERTACGLFSFLSASEFLKNGDVTSTSHNKNVDCAIANFESTSSGGFVNFEQLLRIVQNKIYKDTDIQATSVELVEKNIIGFDAMFSNHLPYSVIFLKNGRFFVVNVDQNGYHVRDCHETTQYDFDDRVLLDTHLSEKYQFNKMIDLSGERGSYTVPEWGSIEFLIANKPFTTTLDLEKSLYFAENQAKNKVEDKYSFDIFLGSSYKSVAPQRVELLDSDIHEDCDLMTTEKRHSQEDEDMQMAMLLQAQEMGDESLTGETMFQKMGEIPYSDSYKQLKAESYELLNNPPDAMKKPYIPKMPMVVNKKYGEKKENMIENLLAYGKPEEKQKKGNTIENLLAYGKPEEKQKKSFV